MKQGLSFRRSIADRLDLPKDIALGEIKVTLYGNCEAWIENYRGLLEYTDTRILLQGCRSASQGFDFSFDTIPMRTCGFQAASRRFDLVRQGGKVWCS